MEPKNTGDKNKRNRQHVLLLAKWLTAYSEIYSREITKEKIEIYAGLLADIAIDALDVALREAAQLCTNFPTPADIRKLLTKHTEREDSFEAEKAWEQVHQTIRRHWFGELMPIMTNKRPESYAGRVEECRGGFLLHPIPFDAAIDFAIRQVGGLDRIASLERKEHDFVRRDFISAVKRHRETLGMLAPSREEAAQLMARLERGELPEGEAE